MLPNRAILAVRQCPEHKVHRPLDRPADTLKNLKPGPSAEQTEANGDKAQQHHGCSDRSQQQTQAVGNQIPRHPPWRERHRHLQRIQPVRFETNAPKEKQRKPEPPLKRKMRRFRIGCGRHATRRHFTRTHPQDAAPQQNRDQADPDPGACAKQIQQQIRQPGADPTACVMDLARGARIGPARVGSIVSQQNQSEQKTRSGVGKPTRFVEQAHGPFGQ